jgi:dihydroneopterin aldolase
MTEPNVAPFPVPQPEPAESQMFIRDLVLTAKIGVYEHERLVAQRIRINLDLTINEAVELGDELDNVVDYSRLLTGIRHLVASTHINLLETLADRIAAMALEDRRVLKARVRVEKLDVFPEAESVGIEIERRQRRR